MAQVQTFTSSEVGPYERGAEFGQHHRSEIARTVAAYRRLFAAIAVRPFDMDMWADRAWSRIRDVVPGAVDEILGMAQGAEVPVSEIAALNARTELLAIANPTGPHECSSVVSRPAGRTPFGVQTWDWYDAMAGNWLHWTIPYPDGRVVETVTEYGMLAKIGVSSHGVGVLFNMLHHSNDGAEVLGFPMHLLSRHILENAHDTAQAAATARSVSVSASTSLTVLDVAGATVSVELFPGGCGLVEPEDGVLARTNHFVSPQGRAGCLANAIGPGSRIRLAKLCSALGQGAPGSAAEVIDLMHDHAGIGGVCAHPDRGLDPVLQHCTLATTVVDPVARSLQVSVGGPCARVRPTSRT